MGRDGEGETADATGGRMRRGPRGRGWPFGLLLAALLGSVVIVSIGLAVTVGLPGALDNATRLLSRQADLTVVDLTERVRAEFTPIETQAYWLAEAMRSGEVSVDDPAAFRTYLRGLLGATPRVNGILYIDRDLRAVGLTRFGTTLTRTDLSSERAVRDFTRDFARLDNDPRPFWGPPVFVPSLSVSLISRRTPVFDGDGRLTGLLLSSVTVAQLSQHLATLAEGIGQNGFILYGRDRVLAHPTLVGGVDDAGTGSPLPRLADIGDPVLREIWQPDRMPLSLLSQVRQVSAHEVRVGDEAFVFQWREVAGLGPKPWIVGTHYPRAALAEITGPLWVAAAASAVVLVAAIVVAALFARALSRPVGRIAAAARDISRLEFDSVRPLPRTAVRELDEAIAAFNAMVDAVRRFEDYVPRGLVPRLMGASPVAGAAVEECEVTVMFADIVGFTGLVEDMSPTAIAALLNGHFARIARVIEQTGGTIDKYIGDGLLAYWGAPEHQPDHAARACIAARGIAEAMRDANESRAAAGEPAICVRIGINTGVAVVGNIGAPGHVNYTIVGDTINVAERIEELGHDFHADGTPATVLISESCLRAAGDSVGAENLGSYPLRGGTGDLVTVYRLVGDAPRRAARTAAR